MYELKHKLLDFTDAMHESIQDNIGEKGDSWRTCNPEYLKYKMVEHANLGHWVDVANYAFMLSYNVYADNQKMQEKAKFSYSTRNVEGQP